MSRLNIEKLHTAIALCGAIFVASLATPATVESENALAAAKPQVFTKCWNYSSLPDLSVLPAADDGRVYFLNVEKKLEAADLHTATKLWSSELGGEVISNLLAVDNALIVVSSTAQPEGREPGPAIVRSLSKHTGVTNWSMAMPQASRVSLGVVNGSVVSVDLGGNITAFNKADGAKLWTTSLGANVSADPHFGANELVVATDKNEVVLVSGNGQTSIVSRTEYLPTAIFIDSARRYLIGDDRGNLFLASADGDRDWTFKNGARISFLLSYDSEFLAASFDNFIYKVSRGGNVEWKRRLTGRVASKPLISGDTAVVSIVGDSSIYFIDLHDGKISNRLEIGDENMAGMVTGAGQSAVVLSGTRGLALYSREKCPAK